MKLIRLSPVCVNWDAPSLRSLNFRIIYDTLVRKDRNGASAFEGDTSGFFTARQGVRNRFSTGCGLFHPTIAVRSALTWPPCSSGGRLVCRSAGLWAAG